VLFFAGREKKKQNLGGGSPPGARSSVGLLGA
jgi:hypothetical protein